MFGPQGQAGMPAVASTRSTHKQSVSRARATALQVCCSSAHSWKVSSRAMRDSRQSGSAERWSIPRSDIAQRPEVC